MTRKEGDLVEAEVRRRLADALSSAGVNSGRISLEILYLLPEEFVREYVELYWQALGENISGSGMGQGKDEGQVLRTRSKGTPKQMRPGQGGGKKYKGLPLVIKDEQALEAKTRIDRKLRRVVGSTIREVKSSMDQSGNSLRKRQVDEHGGAGVIKSAGGARRCEDCGKLMAVEWKRCPFHG